MQPDTSYVEAATISCLDFPKWLNKKVFHPSGIMF